MPSDTPDENLPDDLESESNEAADEGEELDADELDAEEPQDLESQLRLASGSDDDDEQDDGDELSLEQLSESYANVLQVAQPTVETETADSEDEVEEDGELDNDSCPTTPTAIIEALLFVGRADSGEVAGKEIASLMRGVDEAEVDRCVDDLNAAYEQNGHALRIARVGAGYKVVLAEELNYVRDRFYGRVRDIKLNQAAIDCLALVAYQPGVSRKALDDQRGQSSGSVLNQLVRRELLEMRREGAGKTAEAHYYPTEKMLHLAGLASLDDLPQVEDLD